MLTERERKVNPVAPCRPNSQPEGLARRSGVQFHFRRRPGLRNRKDISSPPKIKFEGLTSGYAPPLFQAGSAELYRTRLPLTLARRASEGGKSFPRLRFGLV
jgi:hypothetical protein